MTSWLSCPPLVREVLQQISRSGNFGQRAGRNGRVGGGGFIDEICQMMRSLDVAQCVHYALYSVFTIHNGTMVKAHQLNITVLLLLIFNFLSLSLDNMAYLTIRLCTVATTGYTHNLVV